MSKGKNHAPKQVTLTTKEADALKERIKNKALTNKDVDHLLGLIAFNLWLQERLSRAKLTIKRLRQLFGFKSESKKKSKKSDTNNASKADQPDDPEDSSVEEYPNEKQSSDNVEDNTPENKAVVSVPQWDPDKNHGRYAASDYTGCPVVHITFDDDLLKKGLCPHCATCNTKAKIYSEEPSVLVFLESHPLVSGQQYHLEKGRCTVCKTYFTATLSESLKKRPKYSHRCMTSIAISHYYAGLPFKRIETLQAAQGVPLADATQYDLMNQLYKSAINPVVAVLRQQAANGNSLFFDDTPGRILEQMGKKAIHTTALLSEHEGHRIYLFNTNALTAGKQLSEILHARTSHNTFKTMTDASASNFPELDEDLMARWVITLCLSHGRRRFVELLNHSDDEIQFILDLIAQVYQNEKYCKQEQFNEEERRIYHQIHSAPVMEAMRIWLNNLLLYKKIEPNSRFGEAVSYMLKRWHWLTQFLRIPGAALDNNICEQAIKVVIRYRKNSLFYKTCYGASMGDAIMSLLHTAAHAKVNIFTYLNTLQEYTELVQNTPEAWLPWNYEQTLATLTDTIPMASNSS